jgi:hypothetical protein
MRARPASPGCSRTPAWRAGIPAVTFWAAVPHYVSQWEQAVTEMTAADDEIAEYVQSLEQCGDAEVDGDALAAEFERYLRRRRPGFGR